MREHARAQHVILKKRFLTEGKSLIFIIPFGMLLLGTAVAGWVAIQGEPLYLIIMAVADVVMAIVAWVFFWGRGWFNAWHQRRSDSSLAYPIHHIFGDNGLRVRGRSAEVTIGWRSFKTVAETPEFILFFYSSTAAHYLPKRVATGDQLAELRALIRAHARKSDLQ